MIRVKFNTDNFFQYMREKFTLEAKMLHLAGYYAGEIVNFFGQYQLRFPKDEKGLFWTNRTHSAALNFKSRAFIDGTQVVLTIELLVPYAMYLEFNNEGRYAAVGPLSNYFFPKFLDDVKRMMSEG